MINHLIEIGNKECHVSFTTNLTTWNMNLYDKLSFFDKSEVQVSIDGYKESIRNGSPPKQLSKEFFRQWLINNDFQGKENQELPEITDKIIDDVSNRYIELFNLITGNPFEPRKSDNILEEIEAKIIKFLST